MYLNNSVKFYLYCLGGQSLRNTFINMIACRHSTQQPTKVYTLERNQKSTHDDEGVSNNGN